MIRFITAQSREYLCALIMKAPEGWVCRIDEATRTLDQNAKLWPLLTDISKQVIWHGRKLRQHVWKDIFTAALREAEIVPGLDGNFVVCGQSTSGMGKKEFSELLALIEAFGAEHSVQWRNDRSAIARPLGEPLDAAIAGE